MHVWKKPYRGLRINTVEIFTKNSFFIFSKVCCKHIYFSWTWWFWKIECLFSDHFWSSLSYISKFRSCWFNSRKDIGLESKCWGELRGQLTMAYHVPTTICRQHACANHLTFNYFKSKYEAGFTLKLKYKVGLTQISNLEP